MSRLVTLTIEAETIRAVLARVGNGPAEWLSKSEVQLLGHTRRHLGGDRYEIEANVPDWLARRLMPAEPGEGQGRLI